MSAAEMERVTFASCSFCLNVLNAVSYVSPCVASNRTRAPGSSWPRLDLEMREPFSLLLWEAAIPP